MLKTAGQQAAWRGGVVGASARLWDEENA